MRIKVTENSTERLRLRMTTTAPLFMIFAGVLLVLAGPLVAWLLGHVTEISIRDNALVCRQSLGGKFVTSETSTPLTDITKVGTRVYNHKISRILDVTVFTNRTSYPIPVTSLNGDEKEALAAQIDQSLRSGANFSYQSGMALVWIGLGLGASLTCGGFYCLACLQTSHVDADRSAKIVEVMTTLWLLPITRRRRVEIDQVQNIESREVTVRGRTSATSYRVLVQTKQGDAIALSSGPMFTKDSSEQVCYLLETWLKQSKGKKRKRNKGVRGAGIE